MISASAGEAAENGSGAYALMARDALPENGRPMLSIDDPQFHVDFAVGPMSNERGRASHHRLMMSRTQPARS